MSFKVENKNKYWKSLEQWCDDPEFKSLAEKEFLTSPLSENDGNGDGAESSMARRNFLKLMGASMALTSFACTRRPVQKIIPYVNRPEEVTPGIANHYASSYVMGAGEALGILVTTREGRPIKIEGNTLHPSNRGGMSARAHAHILSLYDPERLSIPQKNLFNEKRTNADTISTTYLKADKAIKAQLEKGKVALLTSSLASPSTRKLCKSFANQFSAPHYQWNPINYGPLAEGQKLSYKKAVIPRYRLDRARYILSVDTDFLGTYLSPTEFTSYFSEQRRKLNEEMNRLVVFESLLSLTGTNADERHRISSMQTYDLLMSLAAELVVVQKRRSYSEKTKIFLKDFTDYDSQLGLPDGTVSRIAKELWKDRKHALVLAGGLETQNANSVHVVANFLNTLLGADGNTVDYSQSYNHIQGSTSDIVKLTESMKKGDIKTLIIHGVNPIYSLGSSEDFKKALKKVEMVIYTGDRKDETGIFSHYILPDHHALENWGDAEIIKGVYSIQQPTIRPLGRTRSFQQSLLSFMGSKKTWHNYVKSYWKQNLYPKHSKGLSFAKFWVKSLQDGVLDTSLSRRSRKSTPRKFNMKALLSTKSIEGGPSEYNVVLYPTIGLQDGSLANVSWLQEFPDPVTKICWDNFVSISPKTAKSLKLSEGEVVVIEIADTVQEIPVHIQPGNHDSTLAIALGYGRWAAGKIANNVGVRAVALMGNKAYASGLVVDELKKTDKKIPLANVQGHHSMEGRQIVVEATLSQYKKNPEANIHRHKTPSLWKEHKYTGHKWGLSIDLNSCTGCGSCILACQSENNIPTVGKEYVLKGREMHWMRVDRYYVGEPDSPDTVHQPLMCMHCDNAPCETVCPVLATVHSDEGTNDMIYNRCVGTRYCANNCPYKVRRFNWFDYTDVEAPLNMAMNPEVTVRSRGVMEKCSMCYHRIAQVKEKAELENRTLLDGEIQTACQQSCPAQAITFGDMNDKTSMVSQKKLEKRTYSLLEELNVKPAVTYQTKIRNTAQLKPRKGQKGGGHH